MSTIDKFMRHRRAALLSMDEGKIRRFMDKWAPGEEMPGANQVFWIAVHKARTAALDLPDLERLRSHQWLTAKGFGSFYEPQGRDERPARPLRTSDL